MQSPWGEKAVNRERVERRPVWFRGGEESECWGREKAERHRSAWQRAIVNNCKFTIVHGQPFDLFSLNFIKNRTRNRLCIHLNRVVSNFPYL